MIDKMGNYPIFDSPTSVYKLNGFSLQELLSEFFKHINEVIELVNQNVIDIKDFKEEVRKRLEEQDIKLDEMNEWLRGEGLVEEVKKNIEIMYEDGTLGNLINEVLLGEINEKLVDLQVEIDGIVTLANVIEVNLEQFPREEGEENDYNRLVRAYNYCKDKNFKQLLLPKSINIGNNTFICDSKFFQIRGATNSDVKVTIKGTGEKIISVREQGFSLDNITLEGDLEEDGDWTLSQTTALSFDYTKQDIDCNLSNVGFIRCNRCIDFKGRNLHAKNTYFGLSNYGIRISKNLNDLNNPNGTDIRGVEFQGLVCHTMGQNIKTRGKVIIEVMDVTNGQDIVFNDVIIEQGAKRFFDGYISGCKLTNIKVSNSRGEGNFINIKNRPNVIALNQGEISGEFYFNKVISNLIDDDMVERCINADILERCIIKLSGGYTRKEFLNANVINQCVIDNNVIYNAGYRDDLDGLGIFSAIKIVKQAINSTIVNNYINATNVKHGIEVNNNNGSYIDNNKIYYSKSTPIFYKSITSSDIETNNLGFGVMNRRNSENIAPNGVIGGFRLKSFNDDVIYDVGELRFIFNSGAKGKESTNIQIYVKQLGEYVRVCSFNGNGVSIENDKFVMLQGKFLWFDSQMRLRCSSGKPSNLDVDGVIVGTQE